MEVENLISEAERSLRDADPLCIDANAYYAELRVLTEQATILWARILFLHAAQQDQLQSMGNICLVMHDSVEKAQAECKQRIKTMKSGRNDLRSLLTTLKQTKVDTAFMGHGTLYQYVHEDDIQSLESQVDTLADQLVKCIADVENLPDNIQNKLGELRTQSPQLTSVIKSTMPRKMVKMTTKAAPFANDMAELLTALTSHYDLCSQIPQLEAEEASEAIQVAMNDRDQVFNALERLKECRTQLKHKHKESQQLQHSLAMSFESLIGYEDSVSCFIKNELRPALVKVSEKQSECQNLFTRVQAISSELAGLAEYYRLFRKSYHALVIEVARRYESHKQLRKVIENANNVLRGFQTRESDSRQLFIDTYQEFLPKELLTNMLEMPREYAIEIEPEDLPELSKSTLTNALKGVEQ